MKNKLSFLLLFIVLLVSVETGNGKKLWETHYMYPHLSIYDMDSFDSLNILLAGNRGRVSLLWSQDAGKSWQSMIPDSAIFDNPKSRAGGYNALALSASNPYLWLVTCDQKTILRSTDQGKSWQKILVDKYLRGDMVKIEMYDENIGYLRTIYALYSTKDGGTTWSKCHVSDDFRCNDFYILNKDTVIISALLPNGPMSLISIDGGINWEVFQDFGDNTAIMHYYFANDKIAWCANMNYTDSNKKTIQTEILKTTDGWLSADTLCALDGKYFNTGKSVSEILFIDDTTGFIYNRREVFRTSDSGKSWVADSIMNYGSDYGTVISKIIFPTPTRGYLANDNYKVYMYDFGNTK